MAHGKLRLALEPWQAAVLGLSFFAVILAGLGALGMAATASVVPVGLVADRAARGRAVDRQVAALPAGDRR